MFIDINYYFLKLLTHPIKKINEILSLYDQKKNTSIMSAETKKERKPVTDK